MHKLTLARNAMATRFEFVLAGHDDPARLRAAGEEALDEIERIESRLSLYRPGSEIAQVNAFASEHPVRVSPPVFQLLERARDLSVLCGGAFDPTVAPLVRCWGFMKGGGSRPADAEIARARELVGVQFLELDENASTVFFRRPGMMLDLGSFGKGYALDVAAEILLESGVENALLHGGTSTIRALGSDPEAGAWKIALEEPDLTLNPASAPRKLLQVIELRNEALSVSAISGKFFVENGKTYGHVIDPRTGWPAADALLGCAIVPSAANSDAFSTAVLLRGEAELEPLARAVPNLKYLRLTREGITHRGNLA